MAATATTATAASKLIQLRSKCLPNATAGSVSVKFFSSSSSNPDHNEDSPHTNSSSPPQPPPPKSPSLYSSLFSDIKATLKQKEGNLQTQLPQTSRPSFNFSNKEEIERNLSEFRRRSAVPPPPSHSSSAQSNKHLSFAELYQTNEASAGEHSSSASSKSVDRSSSLEFISESLKLLRPKNVNNPSERFAKSKDSMSLSRFKESLKMKPGDLSGRDSTNLIGGVDNLPTSVFGKEMEEGNKASGDADTGEVYVKMYNHKDMGELLKSLRPDKKGDWFSLQELNDRLMKLRQIDKGKTNNSAPYEALRSCLVQINKTDKQMKQMPNLDILRHLGRTPSFMMLPPQEQLIEKYFHPDNMSASEKLKLELKKVRDEFKMSESDCGSARIQVAQLTTKIKHLASVLHKKDKHSRKGLLGMVQKRKTLLKYLRRTDWESYSFVLSKLGLRDNPDYKK